MAFWDKVKSVLGFSSNNTEAEVSEPAPVGGGNSNRDLEQLATSFHSAREEGLNNFITAEISPEVVRNTFRRGDALNALEDLGNGTFRVNINQIPDMPNGVTSILEAEYSRLNPVAPAVEVVAEKAPEVAPAPVMQDYVPLAPEPEKVVEKAAPPVEEVTTEKRPRPTVAQFVAEKMFKRDLQDAIDNEIEPQRIRMSEKRAQEFVAEFQKEFDAQGRTDVKAEDFVKFGRTEKGSPFIEIDRKGLTDKCDEVQDAFVEKNNNYKPVALQKFQQKAEAKVAEVEQQADQKIQAVKDKPFEGRAANTFGKGAAKAGQKLDNLADGAREIRDQAKQDWRQFKKDFKEGWQQLKQDAKKLRSDALNGVANALYRGADKAENFIDKRNAVYKATGDGIVTGVTVAAVATYEAGKAVKDTAVEVANSVADDYKMMGQEIGKAAVALDKNVLRYKTHKINHLEKQNEEMITKMDKMAAALEQFTQQSQNGQNGQAPVVVPTLLKSVAPNGQGVKMGLS